jgi:transcriptional regulator with XRE-family HTH domain
MPTIAVIPKIIEFLEYDPEPVPSATHRRIAYARRRLGYTQDDLVNKIGGDTVNLWRWESGRSAPSPEWLTDLQELLDVAGVIPSLF